MGVMAKRHKAEIGQTLIVATSPFQSLTAAGGERVGVLPCAREVRTTDFALRIQHQHLS